VSTLVHPLLHIEIAVLWLMHQLLRTTFIGIVITVGVTALPLVLSVGAIGDLTDVLRERLLGPKIHPNH